MAGRYMERPGWKAPCGVANVPAIHTSRYVQFLAAGSPCGKDRRGCVGEIRFGS
jgi:hypothetical protein